MVLLKKGGITGILTELVGIFVIPNGVCGIACPELAEWGRNPYHIPTPKGSLVPLDDNSGCLAGDVCIYWKNSANIQDAGLLFLETGPIFLIKASEYPVVRLDQFESVTATWRSYVSWLLGYGWLYWKKVVSTESSRRFKTSGRISTAVAIYRGRRFVSHIRGFADLFVSRSNYASS